MMTEDEKEKEESVDCKAVLPYHQKHNNTDLVTVPTFNSELAIIPVEEEKKIVNFSGGTAAFCLDKMVSQHDLMATREHNAENQDERLTMAEKLKKMKSITAGQLFKAMGCHIGKDIFNIHKENIDAERKQQQ